MDPQPGRQQMSAVLAGGPSRLIRRCVMLTFLSALLGLTAMPATATSAPIYVVEVHGVINQLVADRVSRTIKEAETNGAGAIVIELDSPGGTAAATQRVTQNILASSVPIIVYIGPHPNAQALSGAMFIAMAAHITAMASGSSIGTTQAGGLTSGDEFTQQDPRIQEAIQLATTIARTRNRRLDTTLRVVKEQQILSADAALKGGVIDAISPDLETLLQRLDGLAVETSTGTVTLATKTAPITTATPTWREHALRRITNPAVAYVLFSAGVMLIIIALYTAARLTAGMAGVLSLVGAFIAFGNLPVSGMGLGLLILAILLFVGQLYRPRVGALLGGGILVYLAGSAMLYRPVQQHSLLSPSLEVHPVVIGTTVIVLVAVILLIMRALFRVRESQAETTATGLVGRDAIVIQTLAPLGVVRVFNQEWSAITEGTRVEPGSQVRVRAVDHGVLHVTPLATEAATSSGFDTPENGAGGTQ